MGQDDLDVFTPLAALKKQSTTARLLTLTLRHGTREHTPCVVRGARVPSSLLGLLTGGPRPNAVQHKLVTVMAMACTAINF
jgi:hypothetical protein